MTFSLKACDKNSQARRGELKTAHGVIQTPVFMPVGTRGAVKGILPQHLGESGSSIILANTYHMLLRPGSDVVERLGGLHKLMAWNGPILTDSGGYQVFSLSSLNRIGDDGVEFQSHLDGARIYLDAKVATRVQNQLGADIIMAFDECTPYPCDKLKLERAVERTIRWAGICKESHSRVDQLLFAIVQGGVDMDLRSFCARELVGMDFPGYAIGGLSVGEGHENMVNTIRHTAPLLPADKPRYLMGVGMPQDILAAILCGVDMFDCVLPTRNGRNGYAFTFNGPMRLRNSKYIEDTDPLEQGCTCYCCRNFTRAAVRHFCIVGEMLGPILLSIHNIHYYHRMLALARGHIEQGDFGVWARAEIERYLQSGYNQALKVENEQ